MKRKLFCEICPLFYRISVTKGILLRKILWLKNRKNLAKTKKEEILPQLVYKHNSLIRRKLGNVNMELQNNKAINLSLAAPKVDKIIIQPGETFSFWKLVGSCTEKKGYKKGLMIKHNGVDEGIGGGMCQFTNLIHWMVLHSPLEIIEHHHHNQFDMFPDFGRKVPFGSGTSIMYNYLDYQFKNNTNQCFQLITYTTDQYLCGELRCENSLTKSYHIKEDDQYFFKKGNDYFRCNKIYKIVNDKVTGNIVSKELIITNEAKVLYEASYINKDLIK